MFKKIINFWNSDENNSLVNSNEKDLSFKLYYKKSEIGSLKLIKGKWMFEYSANFRSQNSLASLVDFPQKDKKYSSEHLWPFFMARIPSALRPEIKDLILKNNLNENNVGELLQHFGHKTISNPFTLEPVSI